MHSTNTHLYVVPVNMMYIPLSSFSISLLIKAAHRERLLESAHFTGDRVALRLSDQVDAYTSCIDVSSEEARHLLAALLEAHHAHHADQTRPQASC